MAVMARVGVAATNMGASIVGGTLLPSWVDPFPLMLDDSTQVLMLEWQDGSTVDIDIAGFGEMPQSEIDSIVNDPFLTENGKKRSLEFERLDHARW